MQTTARKFATLCAQILHGASVGGAFTRSARLESAVAIRTDLGGLDALERFKDFDPVEPAKTHLSLRFLSIYAAVLATIL
ncbi:hypothetical protein LJR178_005756 [Variovorax sp. LjRoot178]